MNSDDNRKLTRWIVILPIIGVVITAMTLIAIFIEHEKALYKENLYQANSDTIKQNKLLAQERVTNIANFIISSEKTLKKEALEEVKNLTNFAIKIVENTYKENKALKQNEILKKINVKLKDIRFFDNLSGYFFIFDMKGTCVLNPATPNLEGKNLINFKDVKGNLFIKNAITILRENGEDFTDWWWIKPNESKKKKKIGFVKLFKPLDIWIGVGKYEEDITNKIKKDMQQFLLNTRYGDSGYIFAYDYHGKTISHIVKKYVGTNSWDTVIEGGYRIKDLVTGAQTIPEGFFIGNPDLHYDTTNKNIDNKMSFIKDIPQFGWIIGISTYNGYIKNQVQSKNLLLKNELINTMSKTFYVTAGILTLILLITLALSSKLKKVLKNYQQTLINKNRQTLEQKKQIIYQLEHDSLTQLPNRILLADRLEQSINHAKREKKNIAIMFIDIDKFKTINDSLGHNIGDELLIEVARRLQKSVRGSDTVARLGGDEFIVLIDGVVNIHDIITVADKIRSEIKKDIFLDNSVHRISISIGISMFPDDGIDAQMLLKNADMAMYKVKDEGRDNYKFFTSKLNIELQKNLEMERSLHVAVSNNEFVLYYQPIIDTNTNKIVSVEALIRWQHPTDGLIFPDAFIPLAEESNLIIDIGNWVIDEALEQMVRWKKRGYNLERMSINVAPRQLTRKIIPYIRNALERHSCKAEWLEIEVIERSVMKNPKQAIKILQILRSMNIDIAVDDFGTGYSSLSYLKQLPITKLKIDRAFVKNILTSYEDRAIAKAILALGLGLNLNVLAEGVETIKEKEFFQLNGCTLIQGYYYSKPLPAEEIEKFLEVGEVIVTC